MGVFGATRLDERVKRRRLDGTGRTCEHNAPCAKQWLAQLSTDAKAADMHCGTCPGPGQKAKHKLHERVARRAGNLRRLETMGLAAFKKFRMDKPTMRTPIGSTRKRARITRARHARRGGEILGGVHAHA
eukprot:6293800-Pyramimonas_sp.AAC.1